MSVVSVKFDCENADSFIRQLENFAATTKKDLADAFKIQARLLAKELMDRTPPFSGKTVQKMLLARGSSLSHRNADIAEEDMTAKQVGERRVEKDIRRVIYGVRNVSPNRVKERAQVVIGQATDRNTGYDPNGVEFGVRQKCEGRDAVRIFATKGGEVYGVDLQTFKPSATMEEMKATHEEHRIKRGRVTMAGSKDRIVGRWRWLNVLVTKENLVARFIKEKKKAVGQGKGGWAKSFHDLGGRISSGGWIGRHMRAGSSSIKTDGSDIEITLINSSRWASGGDDMRIIEKSLERRSENMKLYCEGVIEKKWRDKYA